MKILFENWRKHLNEEESVSTGGGIGSRVDLPVDSARFRAAPTADAIADHERDLAARRQAAVFPALTPDSTVGQLQSLIETARQAESEQDQSAAKKAAAEAISEEGLKYLLSLDPSGAGPTAAHAWTGAQILRRLEDGINNARAGINNKTIKQFPILDALDVDPHYVRWIEKKELNLLDEAYEKYLAEVPSARKIKDIENMNYFIGKHITEATEGYITISYKPGEKPEE